ncbi:hypothetical protein V6N11_011091 [Hibiscus sabdariffa]|uniref:Reverse transcriptase n=1 Tax=Hibiscus sabdariffa TaxID=183260 RepID=A0ABR2S762_9ROSI
MDILPRKLEHLGRLLWKWGATSKASRKLLKESLEARLKELDDCEPDEEVLAEMINVKLARKKTNTILDIEDSLGRTVSNTEDILEVASAYFSDLFTASQVGDAASILDNVHCGITAEMNNALLEPFKGEEVWAALKTMTPLKAPGPRNGRVNQNIDIRFPRVSDLIVTETNTWRSSLVHSLFDPSLANIILCIPLGKSKPPDELIWRGDNTGIYSPKSGYKILLEDELSSNDLINDPRFTLFKAFYCNL